MDARSQGFLAAIVGDDAARALAKAAVTPGIAWAMVPRAIVAWIEAGPVAAGQLPGVPGAYLELRKDEAGYTGAVSVGDGLYTFADASLYHAAGAIALAVAGEPVEIPTLSQPAMIRLGKAIDQLVKARAGAAPKAPKAQLPGKEAAPKGPEQAEEPQAPVQTQRAQRRPRPKLPTLRVTKSEAATPCVSCGKPHFAGSRYVGCGCFVALAKSVKTEPHGDGYMLSFGGAWDADAIFALADHVKDHHGR